MAKRYALFLPLSVALALPVHAQVQNIDKVNGAITAETGQRYGTLETVNGSIRIEAGAQTGKAETVNGSIRVEANAHSGSLETVNGSITVAERARAGALETVNGSIRVGTGVVIGGPVSTVNGSVFIDRGGRVAGAIETVSGSIGLVDTDVAGGIETVSGDVTVGVSSHVQGGLVYRKPRQWLSISRRRLPRVVIGPDARVDGPLVFEREVALYVHQSAAIGAVTGARPVRFSTAAPPAD